MSTTLEDKDAIRELLADYCYKLDAGDKDAMAALFTEDGTWETAFGTGTTRAGIVAQLDKIAALSTGPRPRRVHYTTNILITLDGDTATVKSNWLVVENRKEGPGINSGGAYHDTVVKRNGTWFFRHRRIDRFLAAEKYEY